MSGTKGTAEIATRSPVTTGLVAGINKQAGRQSYLVPVKSVVKASSKIGIY